MDDDGRYASESERQWTEYFDREGKTFFQKLLSFHRRVFVSRAVRHWFNRYFDKRGVFVEAGAGTSQSSGRIDHFERKLIAVDSCRTVLDEHNILPHKVHADIARLPFEPASIDGIWNLGVMEHFSDADMVRCLREFHRVLKPDARVLLFWPPWFAPYELILNGVSWLARICFRRQIQFFPDEINRYTTRQRARGFLEPAGFRLEATHFDWRDLFSYVVVVGRRR